MSSSRAARVVFWTGVLFLASAVVHAAVWVAADMPSLAGPVSWRKPITFGLSTGVLSLSMAWILSLLPQTRRLVRQATLFSTLLIAEVALIDMQQWRGVASHFNATTAFDGAVFTIMGALIAGVSILIAVWTVAIFRHPLRTTRPYRFAARAGMVMLNAGNVIGVVMAATELTALKPVHGAMLHMIQALPALVWMGARLGYPRAWRDASLSARWLSLPGWRHQ